MRHVFHHAFQTSTSPSRVSIPASRRRMSRPRARVAILLFRPPSHFPGLRTVDLLCSCSLQLKTRRTNERHRRPRRKRRDTTRPGAPIMPHAAVADDEHENLGPISATPELMVRRALDFADVGPNDVVYDLGCNDGRVCVAAATERGARGVGVEIDAGACASARMRVETGACRLS